MSTSHFLSLLKNYFQKQLVKERAYNKKFIKDLAQERLKLATMVQHKAKITKKEIPYLSMNREDVKEIFRVRSRMLAVKANYKNANKDLKCRLCKSSNETQIHVL